jgi:hypothetical protein
MSVLYIAIVGLMFETPRMIHNLGISSDKSQHYSKSSTSNISTFTVVTLGTNKQMFNPVVKHG